MSVDSRWFTSTFVNFLKFLQMKEGGSNFLVGKNSGERLNYLVLPSVFRFQKSEGLKFFIIRCTLISSNWFRSTFLNFLRFLQIKEVGNNFLGGTTNSAERLNYLVPSAVCTFQKFQGLNFFVIHCISMGSNWFSRTFLKFLEFLQIKEGGPNFLVGLSSADRLNYLVPLSVFHF